MATDWDGAAYDKLSDPQFNWGLALLSSIDFAGNETVLDAGCGSGRLTSEILARIPEGRLIALDSSLSMLESARARLEASRRVEFIHADLANFKLSAPVDLVISNAVFHWVPDHEALFAAVHRALKPGGRLIAQFGGAGNLRRLKTRVAELCARELFREFLGGFGDAAHYESAEETEKRLDAAGFHDIQASTQPAPTRFPSREAFAEFVTKVNLHRYVALLPDRLKKAFVENLAEQASKDDPPFTLDYLRLTIRAIA